MQTRSQSLKLAQANQFDLVVIGGGIAGAGLALDAAARGLKVVLVEKGDFASGTSSKTTKLIHGGLRYLEQFQFKLVRELCHERAVLQKLAPHMVHELNFVLPLLKKDPWFSLKAEAGLTVYDVLAWSAGDFHHHNRISRNEIERSAPALSSQLFTGGLHFYDCVTDDSRMVIEVLKTASALGAVVLNYIEVIGIKNKNEVICKDHVDDREVLLQGKIIINAAGVWSDKVSQLIDSSWQNHIAPSKGIHIIVPPSAFETNTGLFLPTPEGRYVFVIPWHRALMIGTTDKAYSGSLDKPLANLDEIDYLLSVVNSYTKTQKLNRSDITGCFAGLRPLIKSQGSKTSTSNLSRDFMIVEGPNGLVNLIGGKLTNYRIMAQQVLDKIIKRLPGVNYVDSPTNKIMLGGWKDKQHFLATTANISAKARRLSIEAATLEHFIANYGVDALILVDLVEKDPSLNERICPDFPFVFAEIPFCIQYEMLVSLEDLLMRRLRLGILHKKQCLMAAPKVAALMQALLKWDNKRVNTELNALEASLNDQMSAVSGMVSH